MQSCYQDSVSAVTLHSGDSYGFQASVIIKEVGLDQVGDRAVWAHPLTVRLPMLLLFAHRRMFRHHCECTS